MNCGIVALTLTTWVQREEMIYFCSAYDMDLGPQLSCALIAFICRINCAAKESGSGPPSLPDASSVRVGEKTSLGVVSEVDMW